MTDRRSEPAGAGICARATACRNLLLLLLSHRVVAQRGAPPPPPPDHPVLASTTCPTRLWQPEELPQVHEINLLMQPSDFTWLVENQALAFDQMLDQAATIVFDGEEFADGEVKVHGGKYQRGAGAWGVREGDGTGLRGGDCYLRGRRDVQYRCKPR